MTYVSFSPFLSTNCLKNLTGPGSSSRVRPAGHMDEGGVGMLSLLVHKGLGIQDWEGLSLHSDH
jgi:hypothetical protein